jgi:hypothetical protein
MRAGTVLFISFLFSMKNRVNGGETVLQQNLKLLNPQF